MKAIRHLLKRWSLRRQIRRLEKARAWMKTVSFPLFYGQSPSTLFEALGGSASPSTRAADHEFNARRLAAWQSLKRIGDQLWNLRSRLESLR